MTTYRLGIVGAAGHVNLILDELQLFPQLDYVACAPSWPEEDFGRLRGSGQSPTCYDDWATMLDRADVDIMVVAGRYDLGAEISMAALAHGCHVIAEKPAAQNLADLARLREAIAASGKLYTLMLPLRFEPAFWTAHQLVQAGAIGEPLLIAGQKSYRWGASRPAWYADRHQYGSTMTWVGIHAFDFAQWVSGGGFSWVMAQHANLVHPERPGCQDVSAVLARLSNGGSATFTMDYLRPETAASHGDDRLRIAGSQGVIEVVDQQVHLIDAAGDQPHYPLMQPELTFLGDIVQALASGHEALVTSAQALAITEFAIQATLAADQGRKITL